MLLSDAWYIAICQQEIQTSEELPSALVHMTRNMKNEALMIYEFTWLLTNVTQLLSLGQC